MNNEQNIKTAPAPASIDAPPDVTGAPSFRDHLRWVIADLGRGDSGTGAPTGDMIRFIDVHCAAQVTAAADYWRLRIIGYQDKLIAALEELAAIRAARAAPAVGALTDAQIEAVALVNGFKLKAQPDGTMALNPYVFATYRALLAAASKPAVCRECNGIGTWIGSHDGADDADCHACDGTGKQAAPTAQPGERDAALDWGIVSAAANEANKKYGQFMPVTWVQAFVSAYNAAMSAPAQGETGGAA